MNFEYIHIGETNSTNHWLREHHPTGNVVVWADYQTAGRGCGTNSWESQPGKNLLFSVLIHPTWIAASQQFQLSMAISIALCRLLQPLLQEPAMPPVAVKWPNDIYVGNKKICGILIENTLNGNRIRDCIIGIGLNINQLNFESDAPNPISLGQLLHRHLHRETILHDAMAQFDQLLTHWDAEAIRAAYRDLLYRKEGYHAYRDANGLFEARLITVEDDGTLVLRDHAQQKRRYAFKEVQFVI